MTIDVTTPTADQLQTIMKEGIDKKDVGRYSCHKPTGNDQEQFPKVLWLNKLCSGPASGADRLYQQPTGSITNQQQIVE